MTNDTSTNGARTSDGPHKPGWAKPYFSKKYHYFRGLISLCGGWESTGLTTKIGKDVHRDNCPTCQTKLKALNEVMS